jgi:hypothetical protein
MNRFFRVPGEIANAPERSWESAGLARAREGEFLCTWNLGSGRLLLSNLLFNRELVFFTVFIQEI